MKRRILPLLLVLLLLLSGCELLPDDGAKPRAASDASIWAMDTQMDLRLYGDEDGKLMAGLTALLNGLDRTLSATDPDSALSALNRDGVTENAQITALAAEALEVSALTGGALDITLLPVSRAWGFTTDAKSVPEPEALEALRDRVGMDRLALRDGKLTDETARKFAALAKKYGR